MFSSQHPLYKSLKKINKVFIAEDDILLSELFKEFVKVLPNLSVIGCSYNGQDVIIDCLKIKPDLIILDINIPEVNGLEVLTILKRKTPETKILITTGNTNLRTITIAVSADANGFIEKSDGIDELKNGIEAVINGNYYYSNSILKLFPDLKYKMRN